MTIAIPCIDFADAFSPDGTTRRHVARQVGEAARDTGFFYVTGHGVPPELIAGQLAAAARFFDLPLAAKMAVGLGNSANQRGYDPIGRQKLDVGAPADLKESMVFGRELGPDHPLVRRGVPFEGANQWPDGLPGFREQVEAYTEAMIRLGRRLAMILALSLDLPEDHFDAGLAEPNCAVRLLHYPPHPGDAARGHLGAGAHTDWGFLTILLQDGTGGLEVRTSDGAWIAADPVADSFVINLGDMVPRLTNGRYHSNLHRVRNTASGSDRYSVATFFNPPFDYAFACAPTCLAPGETPPPPSTFGEHILEMMRRTQAG